MGSPITTWDGVEAYFTGFGGPSVMIIFVLALVATLAAIYFGHRHESHSYDNME